MTSSRTTTPAITSQRLRLGGRPRSGGAVLARDQEQRGEVREQARAADEGEHDGADPEEDRVDVEVAAEAAADAADHAV